MDNTIIKYGKRACLIMGTLVGCLEIFRYFMGGEFRVGFLGISAFGYVSLLHLEALLRGDG